MHHSGTQSDTIPSPPPDVDAAGYHASPGLSWSRLRTRDQSELAFARYAPAESDTFRVGSALHALVLGGPPVVVCTMRRDPRVAAYREWAEAHAGSIVLTEAQDAEVRAMAEAVRASPLAQRHLVTPDATTLTEHVIRWTERGRAARGMLDRYVARTATSPARLIEVKTSRDPSPRAFARQCAALLYHGQMAWYSRGLASLERPVDEWVWIVVGKTAPHDVCVYRATPERRASGHALVDRLLDLLDEDDARHAADPCAPVYGATPDVADLDVMPWEITGELHLGGVALSDADD